MVDAAKEAENGTSKPLELSIPLGNDPVARVALRITPPRSTNAPLVLFLSTSSSGQTNLGSFVYALPPRPPLTEPLSTALYTSEDSIEFATRLAKILVRRCKIPVYVGAGSGFDGPGTGLEGVEGGVKVLKDIVGVVMGVLDKSWS